MFAGLFKRRMRSHRLKFLLKTHSKLNQTSQNMERHQEINEQSKYYHQFTTTAWHFAVLIFPTFHLERDYMLEMCIAAWKHHISSIAAANTGPTKYQGTNNFMQRRKYNRKIQWPFSSFNLVQSPHGFHVQNKFWIHLDNPRYIHGRMPVIDLTKCCELCAWAAQNRIREIFDVCCQMFSDNSLDIEKNSELGRRMKFFQLHTLIANAKPAHIDSFGGIFKVLDEMVIELFFFVSQFH